MFCNARIKPLYKYYNLLYNICQGGLVNRQGREMNKVILLKTGIRMAYTYDPNVHSVCWGVFVGAGSCDESAANNGISHLIEHMCFKGTARRSAFDIVRETDELGADINAFTSKEMTAYYVHCIDESIEPCCDILADIVLYHTFEEGELSREKQVVLEEIDMSADSPDDLVGDMAAAAFWGDSPKARPILGSKENVLSFGREDLFAYQRRLYVSGNVVLSVVGHITEAEAVRLAETYFVFPQGEVAKTYAPYARVPRQCGQSKDIEQSNLVLSYDGFARYDDRIPALTVMDSVFGGGMSSILFQRVREELGLAYSVYSYPSCYIDGGAFNIYLGTNPAKVGQALGTVAELVADFRRRGIDEAQLARGKQQSKSAYVLGLESNMALMRVQARYLLMRNTPFDATENIALLDAVRVQDVLDVAQHVFAAPPSVGVVAKTIDDYMGYFYGDQ